ncbi:YbhB/YbcL family Raf kinase inhibitor-like protein [Phenylobacterium sp.]|uniref:YbhB/YbcL family Raf kinase inhibitor-like protein n=1 Tax=Phenylobacterium sp. TaxID=1871053 RepID=UPI00301D33A2
MKGGFGAILVALALSAASAFSVQAQVVRSTPGQPEARTAVELMPAKGKLTVTTPAFKDGGDIPFENTQYRGNVFPGLTWTKGPAATKSYAIIMQDSSLLVRGAPVLHWTMFNIPPNVTNLEPGMAPDAKPPGSAYGPNYMGSAKPYTGPRTPPGPKDNYHFAVFALDVVLPPEAGATYDALTAAMKNHILASGQVVGLGEKDPQAPPPAPRPAPAQ